MTKEKKILSYTVGYILIGLIICLIGISDVFALTNKTIYSGVNESGLTGSGYYNYGYINEGGVQNTATAKVGNTINGISYGFQFYYYEDIILNNTYTLKINFKDNDLLKSVNSNYFEIQTCNNDNCSNATIISLEKENQNSNSSWAIIKFNPVNKGNIISVNIGTDNNEPITGIQTFGIISIQTEYSNVNQDIIDNNNNITQNIIDSVEGTIKDTFENCRPSINLFNIDSITNGYYYNADLVYSSAANTALSDYINVSGNGNVTLSFNSNANSIIRFNYFNSNKEIISQNVYTTISGKNSKTFSIPSNVSYVRFSYNTSGVSGNTIQLEYGSVSNEYEEFGKEICINKLDEAENTRKGIWETIKNLPNAFMDMLKKLFIPEDGYFEEWFNDLKTFFENKLGFLATPFSIMIDFINRYLQLNPKDDIIINIPDITVPNFEEHVIIQATSLNWSELLKSKESLNTLWELYLAFVDVFLILNFINLCESKYNRIFGGDTSQYEYYTVEDSYTINDQTGEATNHRHNQRTTTRKKVN